MIDLVPPPARLAARPRTWRKGWIVGALVVVLALGGGTWWFLNWRSGLRDLSDYPTVGAGVPKARVGEAWYFGGNLIPQQLIDHPDGQSPLTLDVSSVEPVVVENTSHARISVMWCVLANDGGGPLGELEAEVGQTCARLEPFKPGSKAIGGLKGQTDLVLRVTSQQPGVVRIDGVDITYSSGLRYGSQHTGDQIKVQTRLR